MTARHPSKWKDDTVLAISKTAEAFFASRVVPRAALWAERRCVDRELWKQAGSLGLLCCGIPEQYGGGGGSTLHDLAVIETQAAAPDTSMGIHVHSGIVPHYILNYGTESQRQRWLPALASGRSIGAIAMTEPSAGSDLKRMKSRARATDGGFLLSGSKTFITNGSSADLIIVAARTGDTDSTKDISLLVLETEGCAGLTRGEILHKIGQHGADTCELFFDEVLVPAQNVLGDLGHGFAYLMEQLPFERLITAVSALGAMECAVRETIRYARGRAAFGGTLFDLQNTRFVIAEAVTKVRVVRSFVDDCVAAHADGELDSATAAMAKLWATTMQGEVVDACVQVFGGYGYMQEYAIARLYDALLYTSPRPLDRG
jgi:acyl-CoA dehydrogenase